MDAGFIPGQAVPSGTAMAPQAKVIRAPGLKRGKMEEAISDRIKLECVLGLTVGSNAALACDPKSELVAYPAGCTVVLYNVRKNRQSHVLNASRKSVSCVAFSPDGRYLATGECGHAPAVRVWDLQDPAASGAVQIAEFSGHTHGVNCVAFSTTTKYLVSIGSQHDMIVNVWDWRANLKLASNKVSSRVKALSFSENGNYFVTVGFRHVKFWYLEYSRNAKFKEPVPLMGRSAILGEQKDNEFCDVVCGRGGAADSTYAITRGGLLCEFNSRRLLDKWVELRTTSANCMAISSNYIFVGCANGIVRCFSPQTLNYVTTLPRTHYLGVDVSLGTNINHMFKQPSHANYPDAVALTYDETNYKLSCVYNDHSFYVWDVRDIKRVGKSHSALYHAACIWGMDMVCGEGPLSSGCFLTCSSDDTVRFWNLKHQGGNNNIYSNELSKVVYIDQELKFLKDMDLTATSDKDKSKSYDDKTGVRCVRVSPDGLHVASGDRAGNIWIHDAGQGSLIHTLEAHDAEVLCLEYSVKPRLLASASRDRLIHVFQVDKGYQILQTLDDHSSSITAVRFLSTDGHLQMVSCGADKTILFRQLTTGSDGGHQFARGVNVSGRNTLYDMEIDAGGRHILAACQDRNVRVYSSSQGKHTKTFRGTVAEEGTLIKVALDSSGIYLATSSTDKILSVYDYYSGECMATMYGHSEIVTGLRFTPDCQHLISASGDGCIFVWRVPHDMVVTMRARLAQQAIRQGKKVGHSSNGLSGLDSETDSYLGSPPRDLAFEGTPVVADYNLKIGRLPSWAKKSLGDDLTCSETPLPAPAARGKWARRVASSHIPEKRVDSDGSKDSSLDSGTDTRYVEKRREHASKQRPKSLNISQLSKVETMFRNFDATLRTTYDILAISPRLEKVTLNLPRTPDSRSRHHTDDSSLGSFKYEDHESTEHDGDVEDISDGERTSSSDRGNRPTYYPGNNDDAPGEFMVNAMDVEELRQSQRRSKRWKSDATRLELPLASIAGTSLSGSGQESDDDEVSTPSGDNADRNPLSGSCESIDAAGRREKFLKSAYDSLSGAELDNNTTGGHKSLSSQHLSRGPPVQDRARPSPAPRTTTKTSPLDPEAARRREELNRRILETRRQLENMGVRSNLKCSQSTTDLSYFPEKDQSSRLLGQNIRGRPVSMAAQNNTTRPYGPYDSSYNCPEEYLDSLNTNYYDSLNTCQNMNIDYRSKNPYDIPANLCHRNLPDYRAAAEPGSGKSYPTAGSFKAECADKQNFAFTVDAAGDVETKQLLPRKEPPKVPPKNFHLNLNKVIDSDVKSHQKTSKPTNVRSIFKNYKSCPVSPVSEECKWVDKVAQNQATIPQQQPYYTDPHKRNSLGVFTENPMLPDRGKSIMETIKSDTERMIAEITKKYGDLDEFEPRNPNQNSDLDTHPTKDTNVGNDGNFSSDSLEDCSVSQDASCKNKLYSKKVCRKHSKNKILPRRTVSNYEICRDVDRPVVPAKGPQITHQKSSTLPRNMPSALDDIMDEEYAMGVNYNEMYRCQSVLTKRCVTRSNESVLSDNSNGSSVSNEIFMRFGNEVAFQQTKVAAERFTVNDSQNCSLDNINEIDDQYLERQRHSSASFFLKQKKVMKSSCSQESILSDEMSLTNDNQLSHTNCNSLESVLSDDSDCTKSAPLERIFDFIKYRQQIVKANQPVGVPRNSKSCYEFDNASKSYGSSPNNPPYFGNYMYNNYIGEATSPNCKEKILKPMQSALKPPTNTVHGFDVSVNDNSVAHKTMTRSRSLYDSTMQPPPVPPKNIAYYFDGNNIQQFQKEKKQNDEIPRLNTSSYMANTSKSLQPKFPDKHKYKSEMEGCERNSMVKSKSCSFEVVLEPATKPNVPKALTEKKSSHVQKNLEKFEEQIRKNAQGKVNKNQINKEKANISSKYNKTTKSLERGSGQKNNNGKITMEFVPHKPPKPIKRTSSVKLNNRLKAGMDKSSLSSSISSQYKAKLDGLHNKNYLSNKKPDKNSNVNVNTDNAEKTFDVFIKEKDVNDNKSEMQMDSLDVIVMDRRKQMSMDSLNVLESLNDNFDKDSLDYYAEQDNKRDVYPQTKKDQMTSRDKEFDKPCHSKAASNNQFNTDRREMIEEIKKYKYIERKLEIINKLVEMEERKILQEQLLKEWRMKPLNANLDDGKGVVKVLSKKFDKLANKQKPLPPGLTCMTLEEVDTDTESNSEVKEIKRNLSLPDILDTDHIGGLISESGISKNSDCKQSGDSDNGFASEAKLNNEFISEAPNLPPRSLKQRIYNEMVIPKTDLHIDSENYESSTTSSSCTNSPKRLSILGKHKAPSIKRNLIRVPTPRLCLENKLSPFSNRVRPVIIGAAAARSYGLGGNSLLPKRAPCPPPVLLSKASPTAAGRNTLSPYDMEDENSGMRRAISLSDLAAKPLPAPRTPGQVSNKSNIISGPAAVRSPSGFMRPLPRYAGKNNMTRSSSVDVLNNQSDSESDPQPSLRSSNQTRGSQGLMRPTISSLNKTNAGTARRRGMSSAYSAVSLSTGGLEGSSSETEERERTSSANKPVVPPRPRTVSVDQRMGRSGSERDLSAKAREVTARLTAPTRSRTSHDVKNDSQPNNDAQVSSSQLCSALTEQLTKTASKVVHLYRTLQQDPNSSAVDSSDNAALISGLEAAMLETQKVLRGAVQRQNSASNGRTNGNEALSSLSSTDGEYNRGATNVDNARQRLQDLVSEASNSSNPAISFIDQYSDILLNMMQSKMVNQFPQSPQSLPPNPTQSDRQS